MPKTSPIFPCWFVRDGAKLLQCSKEGFDRAIVEGKSVKYRGYANKRSERVADELEESRMLFLRNPDLSPKFRAAITNPRNVVEVQVILVDDPQFWARESKRPKYHK
ncbi:MAG: hypothetical protein ABSA75_07830 [Candidatus Bathyarchaeia archaeon]|jgi:hypothetical protein